MVTGCIRVLSAFSMGTVLSLAACQPSTSPSAANTSGTASSGSPSKTQSQPAIINLRGKTMGTTYSVKIQPEHKVLTQAVVAQLQTKVDAALERVNDQMSTYRPESEISRFNQHPSTRPFLVSQSTADVVQLSLQVAEQTQGSFDVTLGPVINLWGFDRSGRRKEPPAKAALDAARARVGYHQLHVDGVHLTKDRPDLDVNLSGIAKGYGVDVVSRLLMAQGYQNFMVEIGGEVRAKGTKANGKRWRIGINTPRSDADPTAIVTAISLRDQAMATSGDYRNFFEFGGVRYSHIIDPKTGRPVPHDLVSVSVLGPTCAQVDALATAFLVMGESAARAALKSIQLDSAAKGAQKLSVLFIHADQIHADQIHADQIHADQIHADQTSDKGAGVFKVSRTPGFPEE